MTSYVLYVMYFTVKQLISEFISQQTGIQSSSMFIPAR